MKKRVLTSGAMLAALLFAGANTTFAQPVQSGNSLGTRTTPRMYRTHWTLSDSALAELASKLGLNADTLAEEIKSGKSIQQALKDHGITEDQIKKAFGSVKPKDLRNFNLTDTEIAALASALNVNADEIKNDIAAGKTVKEILALHNVKFKDIKKIFENKKVGVINKNHFNKPHSKSFINLAPEMLTAQSKVLSLSVNDLKKELEAGKTIEQIAEAKGMTLVTYQTNLASMLQTMVNSGEISGKSVNFYKALITKLQTQARLSQ